MTEENEAALRKLALALLERPAGKEGPPEIVVTYRKHEDYEKFVHQISELQEELAKANYSIHQLALYAEENLHLYDQLRAAYKDMKKAGLDTSYLTSVSRKRIK